MSYNPRQAPNPEEWVGIDEAIRIALIAAYHEKAEIELPNVQVHAAVHAMVENMIAIKHDVVLAAMAKLMRQGLDRHESLHAVGAIYMETLHKIVNDASVDKAQHKDILARNVRRRLEKLTAKRWLKTRIKS